MPGFMVKRNLEGEPVGLLRNGDAGIERLTRYGARRWVPSANLEWTGIGGSADWDTATEDEAIVIAGEWGYTRRELLE